VSELISSKCFFIDNIFVIFGGHVSQHSRYKLFFSPASFFILTRQASYNGFFLYYKFNGIDPINKITKLKKYLVKDIIYNAEREIKSLGMEGSCKHGSY
jgi:hypothetical protein